MLMPGRAGALTASGLWQQSGSGNALQANPSYDSRTGNEPLEYKATESITFLEGFESGEGDAFEAYITTGNGSSSGGNGGSGSGLYAEGGYRYGFNGKENDNEVKGEGNQQDYGLRIYDPRLGKFLSVDPMTKAFPYYSSYQFAGNTPIQAIDLDGGEPKGYKWDNPSAKLHPGSGVTKVPSEYDQEPLTTGNVGSYSGIINRYAVQDIDKKTYLIYEDAHGTRQWAVEYENGQWKGNVNEFKWSTRPNSADALTAMTVGPLVGVPGALTYGAAAGGYLWMQALNAGARLYPWLPTIGALGRTGAEFLDETGSIGAANHSRAIIDESRLSHIFRKATGHFLDDTPQARQSLEEIANNADNLLGGDKYGNGWYAKITEKGQQLWAQVRDRKIINGGLNETPREFNAETGLSAMEASKK
jgi:RHS repeat-associated protein